MESWISDLAAHGYSILFAAVFLEAVGFPVPAALALLIAGGASARFVQFLRLNLAAATRYIVAYLAVGFVFSGALEAVTRGYRTFGRGVRMFGMTGMMMVRVRLG
jgi:membrane protein DedA with SNARE-associated domain